MNIKTLAKLCGVSVSTVSRAMNGHPDVSREMREKILRIAKENHYIPNDAARDLVSRRSDAIGLVVKGVGNLFYTPVVREIEKTAEQKGLSLILHQINTEEDELRAGAALAKSKNLNGLVLLGGRCDYTETDLAQMPVPFVCCTYLNSFGALPSAAYAAVAVDDEQTAYDAVSYLLDNGHRDIAILLNSAKDRAIGELRYKGYKRALLDHGIEPDPALTAETNSFSMHGAYNAMRRLIDSGRTFSALFVISDMMAIAAIRAFHDAGLRIPEDRSLIAIDGISVTQYTVPVLTTMVQPAEALGGQAVNVLLELIAGTCENRQIVLNAALRRGESVRSVP